MKPEFICDNCKEELSAKEDEGDCFYAVKNNIVGMSQMKHYNVEKEIILCESCFEEFKEELKDEEDWSELQYLDSDGYRDFYYLKELKEYILRENAQRN